MKARIIFDDGLELSGYVLRGVLEETIHTTPRGRVVHEDVAAKVELLLTDYAQVDLLGNRWEKRIEIR